MSSYCEEKGREQQTGYSTVEKRWQELDLSKTDHAQLSQVRHGTWKLDTTHTHWIEGYDQVSI